MNHLLHLRLSDSGPLLGVFLLRIDQGSEVRMEVVGLQLQSVDPVGDELLPDLLHGIRSRLPRHNHVCEHEYERAEDCRQQAALDVPLHHHGLQVAEAPRQKDPEAEHDNHRNDLKDNEHQVVREHHRLQVHHLAALLHGRATSCGRHHGGLEEVQRREVQAVQDEVTHLVAKQGQDHHVQGQAHEYEMPLEPCIGTLKCYDTAHDREEYLHQYPREEGQQYCECAHQKERLAKPEEREPSATEPTLV
mmetsp:Transcript_84730/g.225036  ORF Transcript_84730/g.225036 Transcript_84730/m.225036 type:complete len:248 (-) Transcript_84730:350-1093(-)